MNDDYEDDDEIPREGPPERAALLRERHAALRERQRQAGDRKLPPGVVLPSRAVPPLRANKLRDTHIESAKRPNSTASTIAKTTLEPKHMAMDPLIEDLNTWQLRTGTTDKAVAAALDVATPALPKWRLGALLPSQKTRDAIIALMKTEPAAATTKRMAPSSTPAPEMPLPGPVLAERLRDQPSPDNNAKPVRNGSASAVALLSESAAEIVPLIAVSQEEMDKINDTLCQASEHPNPIDEMLRAADRGNFVHDPASPIALSVDKVVANLRFLGATQAADAVAAMRAEFLTAGDRAELIELRAMRDNLRKLVTA